MRQQSQQGLQFFLARCAAADRRLPPATFCRLQINLLYSFTQMGFDVLISGRRAGRQLGWLKPARMPICVC